MKIDILTLFPLMVEAGLEEGVVGRARARGLLDIAVHQLRDFTTDRHRVVDDQPFGGGPGMVLKPAPLCRAVHTLRERRGAPDAVVMTTPAGRLFTQAEAERLAALSHFVLVCGRYEGVDERVREALSAEELSIGDYVLSGGELPALVIADAVSRLVPGVVGHEGSVEADSFSTGLLDFPHYTRPAEFGGLRVPEVLLSGNHADILRWRRTEALRRTLERRPDLLGTAILDEEQQQLLREMNDAHTLERDRQRDKESVT